MLIRLHLTLAAMLIAMLIACSALGSAGILPALCAMQAPSRSRLEAGAPRLFRQAPAGNADLRRRLLASSGATADQVTSGTTVNRPVKDKWALVIGISKFHNPSLNLKYPAKDAKDFRDFLVREGNFAEDHVHLLTDEQATRSNILSEIGDKWLPRAANPDDLVVIFISTHGSPSAMDIGGVNYLVAHDTNVESLYATGIPLQDLTRIIKGRVHSDRIVLVLDACHSGAATPDAKGIFRSGNVDLDPIVQGTGQLVISSSEPNQVSWESRQSQNSVFTRHLIESLKRQGSQTKLGEAYSGMKERVQEEVLRDRGVLQTPVLKSKWKGDDLMLAVQPAAPRPAVQSSLALLPPATAPVESRPPDVTSKPSSASRTSEKKAAANPLLVTPPIDLLAGGLADAELLLYDKKFSQAAKKLQSLMGEVGNGDDAAARHVCLIYVLGDVYREQGKFAQAEAQYDKAIALAEKKLDPDSPYLAQALDRLASAYWSDSKPQLAEKPLQRLIALMERTMGLETQEVVDKMSWLQLLYEQQGKKPQARELELKVAELKLKVLRNEK